MIELKDVTKEYSKGISALNGINPVSYTHLDVYKRQVLYSSARNEYMIERMKRLLTRTIWALTKQLEAGDFVPVAYEMRFENGKIDRVDLCKDKDKVYVKVLDYKTGSKAFDVVALYHGLQLQLMVYMDAAVKMTQKHYPDSEVDVYKRQI